MSDEKKKESGHQGRVRRANEKFEAFEPELQKILDDLGPPPMNDPHLLTVWQQSLTGFTAWAFAAGNLTPDQATRLRGINESVRTGGMVAVKAQERKLQREVAKRMGLVKERDDGLDPFPGKPKREA